MVYLYGLSDIGCNKNGEPQAITLTQVSQVNRWLFDRLRKYKVKTVSGGCYPCPLKNM